MSAIAKPFLTTPNATKVDADVNIEQVSAYGALDVDTNLGSGPASGVDYQIVFNMIANDTHQKQIVWHYDAAGARDTDLAAIKTAVATALP